MKSSIMKSRWFLLATSCALLATSLPGNASITVTFKQVGGDVVAAIYGSIEYDIASTNVTRDPGKATDGSPEFYVRGDPSHGFGVLYPNRGKLIIAGSMANPPAGYDRWQYVPVFGYPWNSSDLWDQFLVFDDFRGSDLIISPYATSPFHGQSLTWLDSSLEELDAATFANTVVWTSLDDPSQKVYFTTVPEPSSALACLVGAGGASPVKAGQGI